MMNATNVVRVLLEKAHHASGYAEAARKNAERLVFEAAEYEQKAERDRKFAADCREAAELLQPGCVAEWDAETAEMAQQRALANFVGVAAVQSELRN